MLCAAGLVGVAGDFDGTIVGRGFATDEALRIESAVAATAIGHALGNAAAVCIDEPGEVEHFTKGKGAKVQIESGDEHIVIGIEQVAREDKELVDELSFVDGDALDFLANFFFSCGDGLQNFPWVLRIELEGVHFAVAVWIAAFDDAGSALGIVAGLENQHILTCILPPHIGAPQKFRGLVASHRPQHQFKLARHVRSLLL